jgi:Mg2+ and Co2+ transporter CorA
MTLEDIKNMALSGGGVLFIVATLIQITPIKVNPWSWLCKKIGNALTGELLVEVRQIKDKVDDLETRMIADEKKASEREASNCRTHILRFGDDLLHGIKHSKEHFNHVLLAISTYEKYCDGHPEYLNNVAAATIEQIKKIYQKCLETNDFL